MPMVICYGGPASLALARLAETLGRADDALALYEDALGGAEAVGAAPARARIALHFGAALEGRDRRRAREQLSDAARDGEAIGLTAVAAAARARLERLR